MMSFMLLLKLLTDGIIDVFVQHIGLVFDNNSEQSNIIRISEKDDLCESIHYLIKLASGMFILMIFPCLFSNT